MAKSRIKATAFFIAALALTIFSALAFADNVSVVARWHTAFVEAAGDATRIPARIKGFLPCFDWAAVDYSCASTFIPFLGFLLFAVAMLDVLRGKPRRAESFPFFRSYDRVNVSLGLIGTLWGIIMIGYYDMETVTMASLMLCLHTALFSTLVAVVWVFLFVHPLLLPLARSVLEESGLGINEEDRGLDEAIADLRDAADGVGSILGAEEKAVVELSRSLAGAGGSIDEFSKALKDHVEAMERDRQEIDASFAKRLEALAAAQEDAMAKYAEATSAACKGISETAQAATASVAEAAKAAMEAMAKARAESEAQLASAIEKKLEAMDAADMERRRKFAEALTARLAQIDAAQLEREKKFDDVLQRRIALLEKESIANSERAAEAESKIARIRAAFQ